MGLFTMVPSHADTTNPLTGSYYGAATISLPSTLGTVDLAFYLDVTGTAMQHNSSYIVLEKTLLYPAVPPQINTKDVGPRVTGTISPTSFSLAVDRFSSTIAQQAIYKGSAVLADVTITRDVTLSNTIVTNSGNSISGTYTEIITGLDRNPITLTGPFVLVKPTPVITSSGILPNNEGCIDLIAIKAGGSDPNAVEFSDMSYALHLYYNQSIAPNLCQATREQIIKDALSNYNSTLK